MAQRVTIGDCEVISLHDLDMEFPWQVFFPNVPMNELEAYKDLYPECWGSRGFRTDAGCFIVNSQGKTVLVDTGLGPGPHDWLGGTEGKLLDNMRSLGVPPDSVDVVLHTHLHADHVGWNVSDGKPNFPNATYYGPQKDYEFFSENAAANPQMSQVTPLKDLQRLETYDGEITVTTEVTTVPTPGHTPGHHSIIVNSGGEKLLIAGDLCHHPAQVDRPEWSPGFDIDTQMSAETRRKMVEKLEAEGHLAAFCHFPGDGFGRIARDGNRRVFQAG